MASFKLDDIRAAADEKYGSTDIEVGDEIVALLNPLRLSKEARKTLTDLQSQADVPEDEALEVDQQALFEDMIRTVAKDKKAAERLIAAVAGDLAVLAEIFATYSKGTQAGEA